MRYIYIIFFVLLTKVSLATQVLVLVDGKAITTVDVEKRIKALQIATPTLPNDANMQHHTLNNLVSEELFRNEAKRLKVSVSDEEIKSHFKSLQQDFQFTDSQAKRLMNNESLRQQVESQLLWNKLVSGVFFSKIKVSDAEVRDEQKVRESEIKEVTFKQIMLRPFDVEKIDRIRSEIQDCNTLDKIAKDNGLRGVYKNTFLFNDLNPDLQSVIRNLAINKISEVVSLNDQKQVIMVCDKVVVNNPQNTHQIRQELGARKINAEAQKYLSELKKRIYVEYITPIE
ncbi:MAG: SurA N-terminal domain-containing protein [Rickettsiales bacterium]|jgi:peptidyl-prolyl cis-trans isomerase SurA|nr:SurA N-terminal domain-containing protein [Rickettsiales bacterium]